MDYKITKSTYELLVEAEELVKDSLNYGMFFNNKLSDSKQLVLDYKKAYDIQKQEIKRLNDEINKLNIKLDSVNEEIDEVNYKLNK